jgi:hypothetical protein
MNRCVINLDEVELHSFPPEHAPSGAAAERFAPRIGMLGRQLGASKLGYNLIALAPGKRAFPFHSHRVNEEMFFVVAGQGEMRLGTTVTHCASATWSRVRQAARKRRIRSSTPATWNCGISR